MANILQAFEWMKEGKKVKHSDWVDGSHMYYSSNTYDFRNSAGRPFEISPGDFTAEWEIYEEESELQNRIDTVYKSLKQIELLNGAFVLREAIKLLTNSEISAQ